jgi:hypothetical protein
MEALHIDGQAELARHLLLLIERQAVRVIEFERGRAGQYTIHRGLRFVVEHALGHQEGGGVPMLLVLHDSRHALNRIEQLGVGIAHQFGDEAGYLV